MEILGIFLTDLTTDLDQSKEVIRLLVKELEVWVAKAENDVLTGDDITAIEEMNEQEIYYASVTIDQNELEFKDEIQNDNDEIVNESSEVFYKENILEDVTDDLQNTEGFYECITEVSEKTFKDRLPLKRHQKIDSGEKQSFSQSIRKNPFECKTCKKLFSYQSALMRHEIIHTGEKPFQCKTCNKSFNRAGNLKYHETIHTGEKPYQCKTCNKKFRDSSHMRRHERTHANKLFKIKS